MRDTSPWKGYPDLKVSKVIKSTNHWLGLNFLSLSVWKMDGASHGYVEFLID